MFGQCGGSAGGDTSFAAARSQAHRVRRQRLGPLAEFQLRYRGCEAAQREAGIEPDARLLFEAQSSEDAGHDATLQLLASGVPFDAVFAASDLIAIGVIGALRERGISVPEDVAVVGFDDIASAAHFNPPLTTVQQDTHAPPSRWWTT